MDHGIVLLLALAASIGFFHTLLGPDHYLPFILLSRSRQWSYGKTLRVTLLCGIGHILSSVLIGAIGIAMGIAVFKLESLESVRGDIAAYLLTGFGLAYFIWGMRRAIKNRPHRHSHLHTDGTRHEHEHVHTNGHSHIHVSEHSNKKLTPWVLFLIFVFGPCEPLIPLLMYPAAKNHPMDAVLVASTFGIVTIGTMITIVLVGSYGFKIMNFGMLEKYTHAIAGFTIFLCGLSISFLGL